MMGALQTKMRELFGPSGVDISAVDETATARATIANTAAEIRKRIADRSRLERNLSEALKLEERARAQLDIVGPAMARESQAREADAADRERRVAAGKPGSDAKLAEALERAQRDVSEAERNEAAARSALPALEERVRDAREAIQEAGRRFDELVWRLRMAQLGAELPEVRAAAAVVSDFARRVAVLQDVGLRCKLNGTPGGRVPDELKEVCIIESFDNEWKREQLRPDIQAEVSRLRAMRTDPDATLD